MTSRGKAATEWDEDFNDSSNAYPDDDSSEQLDHTKLYITNLPTGLVQEGLVELFKKYGAVEHAFVSRNPAKKFAIIKYETAGEARVAMMKLNRSEPLKLNISIAHKKPGERQTTEKPRADRQMDRSTYSDRNLDKMNRSRDELSSVSSKHMTKRSIMEGHLEHNGEEIDNVSEESEMLMDYNSNLHYNLETLKLKQLELKEKQLRCQERILLIQQAEKMKHATGPQMKRRILPNGQIVISNSFEASQDNETGYTIGAGDSHNIPGLQRVASRRCVTCGAAAEAYCGRCGVTPYCGGLCQRRDWADRHHAVCHNLARLPKDGTVSESPGNDEPVIPPAAPLRRPHSPVHAQREKRAANSELETKCIPHGERQAAFQQAGRRDTRSNRPEDPVSKTGVRLGHSPRGEGNRPQEQKVRYPQDNDRFQGNQGKHNGQGYRLQKEQDEVNVPTLRPSPHPEARPKPAEVQLKPAEPKPKQAELKTLAADEKKIAPPGTVKDATPRRPIVPTNCVIDKLSPGSVFLATVESPASDCATTQPGYVCVTLHEDYGDAYTRLCEQFAEQCTRDPAEHTPRIGETFAYLNSDDGGWYRARCLSRTRAALIDAGRVVSHSPACSRRLPAEYGDVPEFCAVLNTARLELGVNLSCKLAGPASGGTRVILEDPETALPVGEGLVSRWAPRVEYPAPAAEVIAASVSSKPMEPSSPAFKQPEAPVPEVARPEAKPIPEVARPEVRHNSGYYLVDATSLRRVCVKPATQRANEEFLAALQDTVLYGMEAVPLEAPPQAGQTVVSLYTDGVHYRALVRRTNVAKNKYLVEYVEYGNEETVPLERLYPCPEHLSLTAKPAQVSIITLSDRQPDKLTASALEYIEKFKDDVELTLMIPGGAKTAPSGSRALLVNPRSGEPVGRRIEELCTPHWRLLDEREGDALEFESRHFCDLKFIPLPMGRPFVVRITNKYRETLVNGFVNGYERGAPLADQVYGELSGQINEYAESRLCKEPYLPKLEELCIVRNPQTNKWVRGVLLEHPGGAGSGSARVLYVDYGDVVHSAVGDLRRVPPEFVDPYPALACHLELTDFPRKPTQAQLERAFQFIKRTDEGYFELQVDRCIESNEKVNCIEVKALIAAIK